jgi:phospholipase A-2-activating protein
VIAPSPSLIVSGSRDTTSIAWARSEGSTDQQWNPGTTYRASGGYVSSVTHLPPSADAPKGVSGHLIPKGLSEPPDI